MYIRVKVMPNSKKESFVKEKETKDKDCFIALVKEPAERNMANRRVIELTARHFKVPRNKVRIISGHHSPVKLLSLEPISK